MVPQEPAAEGMPRMVTDHDAVVAEGRLLRNAIANKYGFDLPGPSKDGRNRLDMGAKPSRKLSNSGSPIRLFQKPAQDGSPTKWRYVSKDGPQTNSLPVAEKPSLSASSSSSSSLGKTSGGRALKEAIERFGPRRGVEKAYKDKAKGPFSDGLEAPELSRAKPPSPPPRRPKPIDDTNPFSKAYKPPARVHDDTNPFSASYKAPERWRSSPFSEPHNDRPPKPSAPPPPPARAPNHAPKTKSKAPPPPSTDESLAADRGKKRRRGITDAFKDATSGSFKHNRWGWKIIALYGLPSHPSHHHLPYTYYDHESPSRKQHQVSLRYPIMRLSSRPSRSNVPTFPF
ncbi:hypothetical protein L249_5230, partial [Ophiocordyceps polyrhachis-furcata BCC 54312]